MSQIAGLHEVMAEHVGRHPETDIYLSHPGFAVVLAARGHFPGLRHARRIALVHGAYYDALRARDSGHHAALRQLANRLVGILHDCLKTGAVYDENTA